MAAWEKKSWKYKQHEYRLFGNTTSVIVRALALHIRNRKHITLILLASTPSSFGSEGSQLILGVAVNYARPQPKWDRCFEEDRFTCYPIQNSHLRSHTRKKHSVSRAQCRFFSARCFYSPWQWFYMPHQKRKNFKHFLNYLFVISTWYISLPNCFPFTKRKYTDYSLQFVFYCKTLHALPNDAPQAFLGNFHFWQNQDHIHDDKWAEFEITIWITSQKTKHLSLQGIKTNLQSQQNSHWLISFLIIEA